MLELGSGTGIGGLSLIKFSKAKKVILTDYTEEILALLEENVRLQPSKAVQNEISLIDWTDAKCFERLRDIAIDCVIATDVIYKGSPY